MLHDNPELPLTTKEEMTQKIVNNCQRMTRLIRDLLTLSDTENIPLSQLEECPLLPIIEQCCNRVYDVFPDAKIDIRQLTDEEMIATVDPSLMELAFMNLIENAAKYSTPPAEITIIMQKENDKIKMTISDKGLGIPRQDLEHIFERFYTVDKAHSQKMGGSGLGLSIVQNIIHKHFGQISLESEMGKGTTFTIILPAA
jgi:two-component system phosphate regulon sensor histidine kinase PhoR